MTTNKTTPETPATVTPRIRGGREPILVGVDDGYAMTKIALPDGKLLQIPSRARTGVHGVSSLGRGGDEELDCGYETEGGQYTVGRYVEGEGTRFDDYPFSPLNRVVVHHALRLAGLSGRQVKVATGLPVKHYFVGTQPNAAVIKRKTGSLDKPVTPILAGALSADIVMNYVFAEGVAAWIDHAIDAKGNVVVDMGAPAAVVDIGGRTTDCVLVLPGLKVDHARSGTGEIGVLRLYDIVASRVQQAHGVSEVPLYAVEDAVRTGKIRLWGKDTDISEIVADAKREVGEQILREVQRRIGYGADLDKVVFVGGGAVVFDQMRSAYRNACVPEKPEFANARGLLKFMMHVM